LNAQSFDVRKGNRLAVKRRTVAIIVCSVAVAVCLVWARAEGPLRSLEAAFQDFTKAKDRAEDQLTDPLVLAGPRVRPLAHAAVKDRSFPLRRYAIGYLGCAKYAAATTTFQAILNDESEKDYFRADALEALWSIDHANGLRLANEYSARADSLGHVARGLLVGTWPQSCRSWRDAFLHTHE
jgi:hypothetical protein